ncbi:MAG TPA: hypothetical protein VMF53_17375 [Alphaproteobacteria bacterium]|nr:hypothetical protein [Alphaproteobacteria bacterium]
MNRTVAFAAVLLAAAILFGSACGDSAHAGPYSCRGQTLENNGPLVPVCSKTFGSFSGTCGTPAYSFPDWGDVAWYMVPWESNSITIISAHASILISAPSSHDLYIEAMIGNSYSPDPVVPFQFTSRPSAAILTLDLGYQFPAGYGMPFPAPSTPTQIKAIGGVDYHLDLHLSCPRGAKYQGYVTIDYLVNPN